MTSAWRRCVQFDTPSRLFDVDRSARPGVSRQWQWRALFADQLHEAVGRVLSVYRRASATHSYFVVVVFAFRHSDPNQAAAAARSLAHHPSSTRI